MKKGKKVFVGMSGGVDSSVAALRLLQQGYDVTGVFIKVWHPDFMVCNWEDERIDAMRVAAHLGIPFMTCDAEAAYRDEVAEYFINSYRLGITPNPDVMCNKSIKFGVFLDFALAHGADYIATGHYVRKITQGDTAYLHRGIDHEKDQSYFLWMLNQQQIQHSLFPVGDTDKITIRHEAAEAKLPTAQKKDSQGVCFLGHVDIPEFLSHYIDLVPGPVVDEAGVVIGQHRGVFVYTLGQRHGFTITSHTNSRQPYYVVAKDVSSNTLHVSPTPPALETKTTIDLHDLQLQTPPELGAQYTAQFRYRQKPLPIIVTDRTDSVITIELQTEAEKPSVGQSCVLYCNDRCVGGGIISA